METKSHSKRQSLRWADVRIGVFVSIALFLLFIIIFLSDPLAAIFSPTTALFITINNSGSLQPEAPVQLDGVRIGTVSGIRLTGNKVVILTKISNDYFSLVSKDSYAEVKSSSLVGNKIIEIINGGQSAVPVMPGDTIPGKLIDPMENVNQILSSASLRQTLSTAWQNLC